jgi:dolichol-phosphate mannosyltransferase
LLALSVVVPCFNEEAVLAELERRLSAVCNQVAAEDYEIIVVNDGSRDQTGKLIRDMAARNSRIIGIDLARNYGHQIALTAGLSFARGRRILILDADLQDPPELLPAMMRLMDEGANVVYGRRIERERESTFKVVTANWFYKLMSRLTEVSIPEHAGDFRLIDRKTLTVFLSMPETHRFVRGMIAWIGLRQVELPYERCERFAGRSHYPIQKMALLALDAVTGFSIAPLRLALYLALGFVAVTGLLMVYVLVGWLSGEAVHGWASTLALLLLFSSVQLLCISIVGEYVGRIYIQSKQRPLFVIQEVYGGADAQNAACAELTNTHAYDLQL